MGAVVEPLAGTVGQEAAVDPGEQLHVGVGTGIAWGIAGQQEQVHVQAGMGIGQEEQAVVDP